MRYCKSIALVLALAATMTAAGCGQLNSRVGSALSLNTDLKVSLQARVLINPDENNNSSPVHLRLYELTSPRAFESAQFMDLYQADSQTLGDTMIARQDIGVLLPAGSRVERFVVSPETRYVGIFAEFFQYQGGQGKIVFAVDSQNVIENTVQVVVDGNQLALQSSR